MKPAKLRQHAKATTEQIARLHAGKGCVPPIPAQPGSAQEVVVAGVGSAGGTSSAVGVGQPINMASISQVASYPPRNSGNNPGNN